MIKDSGNRRQFESGAVRDIQEGKGRCDLLPLKEVGHMLSNPTFVFIDLFMQDGRPSHLYDALTSCGVFHDPYTMMLEVSKHFEAGNNKYPPTEDGTPNWKLGIPVRSFIDSGVRHYLKWLRGDEDEVHSSAFCWNMLCAIWTCNNKPELNEYRKGEEK